MRHLFGLNGRKLFRRLKGSTAAFSGCLRAERRLMKIFHAEEWIRRSRPPALYTNHISISSFFLFPREAVSSMVCDLAPRLATLKASIYLHRTILWAMVRAPLLFFDQTPTGRILSRFSSDVEATDNKIPEIISDGIWCFFEVTNQHFEHPQPLGVHAAMARRAS